MANIFLIEVQKVVVGGGPEKGKVASEMIRGDLVIGVREWNKSTKDMMVVGKSQPMTLVTMINPLTHEKDLVRIAEEHNDFSQRLMYESSTKRRTAPKPSSQEVSD